LQAEHFVKIFDQKPTRQPFETSIEPLKFHNIAGFRIVSMKMLRLSPRTPIILIESGHQQSNCFSSFEMLTLDDRLVAAAREVTQSDFVRLKNTLALWKMYLKLLDQNPDDFQIARAERRPQQCVACWRHVIDASPCGAVNKLRYRIHEAQNGLLCTDSGQRDGRTAAYDRGPIRNCFDQSRNTLGRPNVAESSGRSAAIIGVDIVH